MKQVEVYTWRIQWCGKWSNTRYKCTEEDIRAKHPEAIRQDHTREVRRILETPEDLRLHASRGSVHVSRPATGNP